MIIQNYYSINFRAKKTPLLDNCRKNLKEIISNNELLQNNSLYTDIDKYLNKKCSKEEYLTTFIANLNNKNYPKNLKNSEKIYINDLKTSIDLSYSLKDIPDGYLINRIKQLLQMQK